MYADLNRLGRVISELYILTIVSILTLELEEPSCTLAEFSSLQAFSNQP
jgi:hypothetical protein